MKRIITIVLLIVVSHVLVSGQESGFSISISPDTILMGNSFRVDYKIENVSDPNFQPPVFDNFKIVGGPNQSSSMTVMNGEMSQSMTYSYYLEPAMEGQFFLAPAKIGTEDNTLFTEPLEVIVLPNPEGIIQQPKSTRSFGWGSDFFQMPEFPTRKAPATKPKKKRKTYKL